MAYEPTQEDLEDALEVVDLVRDPGEPSPPSRAVQAVPASKELEPQKAVAFDPPPKKVQAELFVPVAPKTPQEEAAVDIATDLGITYQAALAFVAAHWPRLGPDRFWTVYATQLGIVGADLRSIGKAMKEAVFAPADQLPTAAEQVAMAKDAPRRTEVARTFGELIRQRLAGELTQPQLVDRIRDLSEEMRIKR